MASLIKDIFIAASSDRIWDAARDVGALHTRLVPGFVVDTRLAPGERVVTFANGVTLREPIVSLDDERRRLAWSSIGGITTHYNAVLEVIAEGEGTRVRWTIDFLPDEVGPRISAMQDQGMAAMKRAFER